MTRVNDNILYVARQPQGFTSEDRVMTAKEEGNKSTAQACSDALDVICVWEGGGGCLRSSIWMCLCAQLL